MHSKFVKIQHFVLLYPFDFKMTTEYITGSKIKQSYQVFANSLHRWCDGGRLQSIRTGLAPSDDVPSGPLFLLTSFQVTR
jgi:hypothetical protein